jgi:hypothetical protein
MLTTRRDWNVHGCDEANTEGIRNYHTTNQGILWGLVWTPNYTKIQVLVLTV